MSGERTPILSNVIPAFEMLMSAWEKLGEKRENLKRFTNVGVEWAVKYYNRMDLTKAYVVAMGMTYCLLLLLQLEVSTN